MMRKSGPTPCIWSGFQLASPPITWGPPAATSGLTARTAGHSSAMAWASSGVRLVTRPSRTPLGLSLNRGNTRMTFDPRFRNSFWMRACPPCPIDTMTVTAAIPITTPRMVSRLRRVFLRSCRMDRTTRSATRTGVLPFEAGHQLLAGLDVPADQFGPLPVLQADGDGDGLHLDAVGHPDDPLVPLLGLLGPPLGGQFFLPLLRVLLGLHLDVLL